MACFYLWRKLIHRFTYRQCITIPKKTLSTIAHITIDQIILGIDAQIISELYYQGASKVIEYRNGEVSDLNNGNNLPAYVSGYGLKTILQTGAIVYPLATACGRLYNNKVFLVQNLIR